MCSHLSDPQWALTLTLAHPDWPEPWHNTVECCESCLLGMVGRMQRGATAPEILSEKRTRVPTSDRTRENARAGHIKRRRG